MVVTVTMCAVNMGNHVKPLLLFIKELLICGRMLCAQKVNLNHGTNTNACLAIAQCVGYKIYPSIPKNLQDQFLMLSNGIALLWKPRCPRMANHWRNSHWCTRQYQMNSLTILNENCSTLLNVILWHNGKTSNLNNPLNLSLPT